MTGRLRRRLSLGYLVSGLVLGAAYFVLGTPELLYLVIGASAPVVIVAAVLVFGPPLRRVWLLVAAGQSLFVVGDIAWYVLAPSHGGPAPFPSASDALYLTAYVLLTAGLVTFARGPLRFQRSEAVLDAVILSIGCALLLSRWVFAPTADPGVGWPASVAAMTYPLFDFLLLGLAIRLVHRGRPVPAELFVIGALCALAVGDIGYVHESLLGTHDLRHVVEASWLVSYLLFGAAALHPSLNRAFERDERHSDLLAARRIGVLVAGCVLTPIGLLGATRFHTSLEPVERALLGIFFLALIARLALMIVELRGVVRVAAEAETRFRAVFDAARAGITVGGPDGTIRAANPALARMLGYETHELEGMHFREFTPYADDVEADEDLSEELAAGTRDDYRLEKQYRRKDGSIFWGSLQVTAAQIEGEPGVIAIVEDLTEIHELDSRLRQSQKLEAMGRLAGGIAHDFNNLLTVISGFASVGLGRTTDPGLRYTMEQIEEAAERASGLTSQLLTFGRGHVVAAEQLDLNVVVARSAPLLERLLSPGMTLQLRLAGSPACVLADERQIEQVLMNLVVNASDSSAPGAAVTILIEGAGEQVRLAVRDEGHGMDEQTRARAFEPFFTTKAIGSGTGLGLATVYGTVTQFGGEVTIESAPGEGTTVTLVLPAAHSSRGVVASLAESAAPEPQAGGALVLVAEDDEAVADVVAMLLADAGYRVQLCASGEAALEFAETGLAGVDVLLTDIRMPGIDGFELAASLLAKRPELPIVFMSGYAEIDSDRAEIRHGRPWLRKPFDPVELDSAIAEALAGSRAAA